MFARPSRRAAPIAVLPPVPTTHVPIGRNVDGTLAALPLDRVLRHSWITGKTGAGKSGFVLSRVLAILTRHKHVRVVVPDWKGETAETLRDQLIPVAVAPVRPDLTPRTIQTVAAFGSFLTPLDPLAPVPGLGTEVQAHTVASLIDSMAHGLGPRMRAVLTPILQAAILARANLMDVRRALTDESHRAVLATRCGDARLHRYLTDTFDDEPDASIQALRARLDDLLLLPNIRAMLCAGKCVSGQDLLDAPLSIIDLSGAPPGLQSVARFVGQLAMTKLIDGVFARPHGGDQAPVLIVCDEWQELIGPLADSFEAVLAQARSRRVSMHLVNQSAAQIEKVSSSLLPILTTNLALHIAFKPEASDLAHARRLLPVTGRRIDPARTDKLLGRDAERELLLDELARLPERHALLVDLIEGRSGVIRSLSIPFDRVEAEASRLSQATRDAWRAGRSGVPAATLIARAHETLVVDRRGDDEAPAATGTDGPAHAAPRAKARARPKLVIP